MEEMEDLPEDPFSSPYLIVLAESIQAEEPVVAQDDPFNTGENWDEGKLTLTRQIRDHEPLLIFTNRFKSSRIPKCPSFLHSPIHIEAEPNPSKLLLPDLLNQISLPVI